MTELATQELARARAARIREGIATYLHTLADVAAAYAQRDWKALGYADWQAYVDGEYGAERLRLSPEHRAKAVAELRLAGMSQRAIGTALGVDQTTVLRDLRRGDADASPAEVQGADGKTYASTRPQTPAPMPEPEPEASTGHDNPQSRAGEAYAGPSTQVSDPRPAPEAETEFRGSAEAGDPTGPAVDFPPSPDRSDPSFGEVLDRLVPDDNPHREWQGNFLKAISGVNRLMLFAPADVAEKADEQCAEELVRVADRLATWRAEVMQARKAAIPHNVTPIRRIS